MDCNAVAEGAVAVDKQPPICDERDETEYAAKQCGSDGMKLIQIYVILFRICIVHLSKQCTQYSSYDRYVTFQAYATVSQLMEKSRRRMSETTTSVVSHT